MSTVTESATVPAASASPKEGTDYASAFYGMTTPNVAATPDADTRPELKQDTDPTPQPKADATPPVDAKKEESPKGTEDEKEKDDAVKAQLKSQREANGRLGKENAELRAELKKLADEVAKLNGTYKEPAKPTEEELLKQSEFRGKERASRGVAEQLFGVDAVKEKIYDTDSAYEKTIKTKPWLHVEVVESDQPAVTAMRVLYREEFMDKYGSDPTQWHAKIEAELRPKLLQEFQKQAATPVTGKPVASVTDARGEVSSSHGRERSLTDMFYGKG